MIERVILLKLNDPGRREALAAEATRVLPGLPGVREVRVGLPADQDAEVWDLLLAVRFESLAEVTAYLADPAHTAFVEEVLAPNVTVRKAWNFLLTD